MKPLQSFAFLAAVLVMTTVAPAQQPAACSDQLPTGGFTQITFPNGWIDLGYLLTDGRVMVQYVGNGTGNAFQDWWALTPDINGNYVNGSWSELATLNGVFPPPAQYGPYGFASAVLADGRLIVQGGEENPADPMSDTNMGAIYDPSSNSWSILNPPGFGTTQLWPHIGDAQTVVLNDGTYMVAGCGTASNCTQSKDQAILDPNTLTWTLLTGDGKLDNNSEEGYTLLPGGNVFTADISNQKYEIFNWQTRTWSNGNVPVVLSGDWPAVGEIGPGVLLTDGTVLALGAIHNHIFAQTANADVYDPVANDWPNPALTLPEDSQGRNLGMGDESAVLLTDGNVFLSAHDWLNGYGFIEYQPASKSWCSISNVPTALLTSLTSDLRMLLLPTGQVLILDYDPINKISVGSYIYTPMAGFNNAWRPTISGIIGAGTTITRGRTYTITGTQFNGLSQATMFGDDYQAATNYPLVRITNNGTQHVFYGKTHNHSTMAVATGSASVSTKFDVPANMETGASTLVVVANGIPSTGFPINVQ
jgi:hypothetical protein